MKIYNTVILEIDASQNENLQVKIDAPKFLQGGIKS